MANYGIEYDLAGFDNSWHRGGHVADWTTGNFLQGQGGKWTDQDIKQGKGGYGGGFLNEWSGPVQNTGYWDKHSDFVLDPDREWKTHWKAGRKQGQWHDEASGVDPTQYGWEQGVHATTGRERNMVRDKWNNDTGMNLVEVLDYDAYNRDPLYAKARDALGLNNIASLQNIYDVEDYLTAPPTEAGATPEQLQELGKITGLQTGQTDIKNQLTDWFGTADEEGVYSGGKLQEGGGFVTADESKAALGNLESQLKTWFGEQPVTELGTGDIKGLDETLSNLISQYGGVQSAFHNVADVIGGKDGIKDQIGDINKSLGDYVKSDDLDLSQFQTGEQVDAAISDYLKDDYYTKSDADTAMTNRLETLKQTLGGDFSSQIAGLSLEDITGDLTTKDLKDLLSDFSGLSDDVSWVKDIKDLDDLKGVIGEDRQQDLTDIYDKAMKDSGTATDALGANLRQEFGDKIFDLTDTFGGKLDDKIDPLSKDIQSLFGSTGSLETGLEGLKDTTGTLGQDLTTLSEGFGDYKSDISDKFSDLSESTATKLSGMGTDITNVYKDLGTHKGETTEQIQKSEERTAKSISDVAGTFGKQLESQDKALTGKIAGVDQRLQDRLTALSSSMNYRKLGDSAQGVKIRRSKAYKSGRTAAGTGQLGRSMKISSLNL